MKTASPAATLVLGIGNLLLTDEGAGIHVVRYLARHPPKLPKVDYLDGGTLNFLLAPRIEGVSQLVVVDAANIGEIPGRYRTFEGEQMDRFLQATGRSAHEVGLFDLLTMARLAGRLPAQRALLGIQPFSFDWGDHPSPVVARAIPQVADEVVQLVTRWRVRASTGR